MKFPIVDGNSRHAARIVYLGKENIKADNGHKYRCLRLTYYEYEDEKWRDIASFTSLMTRTTSPSALICA